MVRHNFKILNSNFWESRGRWNTLAPISVYYAECNANVSGYLTFKWINLFKVKKFSLHVLENFWRSIS